MGKKKLGVFFKDFLPEDLISNCDGGYINNIEINTQDSLMNIEVVFDAVLDKKTIMECEKYISQALKIKVKILPKYNRECFCESYWGSIILELIRRGTIVNGFLNDSIATLDDDTLNIDLFHGGVDILLSAMADRNIEAIIRDEFSLNLKVIFSESKEATESLISSEPNIVKIKQTVLKPSPKGDSSSSGVYMTSCDLTGTDILPDTCEVVFGKEITGEITKLDEISIETGKVTVWGDVFQISSREAKNGTLLILSIYITDYTNSITVKILVDKKKTQKLENIVVGDTILVNGTVMEDMYDKELNIRPINISKVKKTVICDDAAEKRVELHLHTNMSSLDGVSSVKDLIKHAYSWGHKAVAVTDHGVAQAFPEAMNTVEDIWKKDENFKVIYGVEGYYVNDMITAVENPKDMPLDGCFVVFDLETTGLNATYERITEIGAVKVINGEAVETFSTFVNPQKPISRKDNRSSRELQMQWSPTLRVRMRL